MDHHRHHRIHLLEKLQVELVGLLALVAVYYWLWPVIRWPDHSTAVAFIPTGSMSAAARLAGVVCLLAAVCAVATVSSRPLGAMLAAQVGICGVSCHSAGLRTLFWLDQDASAAGLFGLLMAEIVMLTGVFFLAGVVIALVRKCIEAAAPKWVWKDPLAELSERQRSRMVPDPPESGLATALPSPLRELLVHFWRKGTRHAGRRRWDRSMFLRCVACVLAGSIMAVVPLLLVMRSTERGQVLFALVASFLVAGLVAHQRFPVPYTIVGVLMASVTAVVFYTMAAMSAIGSGPRAWMLLPTYANALPIDWLTAGGGGGVIGFWISERIHELRYVEQHQQDQEDRKGKSDA